MSATLGILMLDTHFPRSLGDIGLPGGFAFPVRHNTVARAYLAPVARAGDPALLKPLVVAARTQVDECAVALATRCGLLAHRQRELLTVLPVPIWSSILLLLHRLQAKRPGVITIQAPSLTRVHLETIDAHPATPCEGVSSRRAVHRTLLQDRTELAPVDVQTLEQATQVVVHHIVSMLHRRMASLSVGQGAGA